MFSYFFSPRFISISIYYTQRVTIKAVRDHTKFQCNDILCIIFVYIIHSSFRAIYFFDKWVLVFFLFSPYFIFLFFLLFSNEDNTGYTRETRWMAQLPDSQQLRWRSVLCFFDFIIISTHVILGYVLVMGDSLPVIALLVWCAGYICFRASNLERSLDFNYATLSVI